MSHPVTNPPTPEGDDGEQFLSNADLGRRYNKSRMTIHRWQKAGYLPAPVLIGNKLPITSLSELRALEASLPRFSSGTNMVAIALTLTMSLLRGCWATSRAD